MLGLHAICNRRQRRAKRSPNISQRSQVENGLRKHWILRQHPYKTKSILPSWVQSHLHVLVRNHLECTWSSVERSPTSRTRLLLRYIWGRSTNKRKRRSNRQTPSTSTKNSCPIYRQPRRAGKWAIWRYDRIRTTREYYRRGRSR